MSAGVITEERPYLTFKLADEVFALDVAQVREILDAGVVTRVPRTPEFMLGVINLRGAVVPVIDMRRKLGLPAGERTVNTSIVVLDAHVEDERVVLGALVDSVQEVFELEPSQVEPPPRLGTHLRAGCLRGMGKRGDRFVMLLDIDKVFDAADLGS